MLALVACSTLLAVGLDAPPATTDANQSYQEAKAKAGRSPEEQVRLALWCEAHGLSTQRLHHLTLAILADPKNLTARGLMGLVLHDGRWQRPEVLADKAKADPALAEYQLKRVKAAYTADGQWAMGVWAEEHGLKDQARAHLTAVIRLDPTREAAWKRLGYKKHEGRWITDAQLAAEKADAEAQKQADRKWKPLLEKYKAMLDQPSKREEAEAALASVTDPRAVPSIGLVFARSEATQPRAVQLLGQVDSPSASKALAFLAVFAKSAEARRAATETLRGRDAREYADLLVALIRDPIKYEVKPVGGPGSPGVLFIEGKQANLKRIYAAAAPSLMPGDRFDYDPQYGPVILRNMGNSSTGVDPSRTGWPSRGLSRRGSCNAQVEDCWRVTARRPRRKRERSWSGRVRPVSGSPESRIIRASAKAAAQAEHAISPTANKAEIPVAQIEDEARKSAVAASSNSPMTSAILEGINEGPDRLQRPGRWRPQLRNRPESLSPDREAWKKWWIDLLGYRFDHAG